MPKIAKLEPVIHQWVCALPFQMQALLLTAMRGPDENNKYNSAKGIVRYLRGVVIKPAGEWSGLNDNDFMWGDYVGSTHRAGFEAFANGFFGDHDEYPHHFIMHLVHCAQVVGYKHPGQDIRKYWRDFYETACESFHMNPETEEEMESRLNDFGCGWHNGFALTDCTSTKHNSSCLQKAPDDEPIFVLRSSDPSAPELVREWAKKNSAIQSDVKKDSALLIADDMERYFVQHYAQEAGS